MWIKMWYNFSGWSKLKKWLFLLIFLLVGCSGDQENLDVSFEGDYYKVYYPYKESVGNYSLESYDKEDVEKMLMTLSTKYFKPSNSYFQEGQYLNENDIKNLLKKLNKNDENFNYIKSIYEQNYLYEDGNLKGVSIAIIVDPIQEYKEDGKIVKEEIKESKVIKYAKDRSSEIIKYLREKVGNTRIVLAIYVDSDDSYFDSIGMTSDDKIKFSSLTTHYETLNSKYVSTNDTFNYNSYIELKQALSYIDYYMESKVLYQDSEALSVTININTKYLTRAKLLYLTEVVGDNINFSSLTKVYIKYNNTPKALIVKEKNNLEVKIYLLEE